LVTEVHHGPGVYCGPPDVYRGPLYEEYALELSIIIYCC